jgi:glyoxylase-like metal-dependent hydrolase (beta-lactamase superfamily II)
MKQVDRITGVKKSCHIWENMKSYRKRGGEMNNQPLEIIPGIYCVGGPEFSHPQDALAYLVIGEESSALIDTGAGKGSAVIWDNIDQAGLDPEDLTYIILTHGHVDHIGGAAFFKDRSRGLTVAHRLDQAAIETGDPIFTAASWYGVSLPPLKVDRALDAKTEELPLGQKEKLLCLHTPGHTPGSISLYIDREDQRILFGQDIHGPFSQAFGSSLSDWKNSMKDLLDLKADILCEGHFGVYRSSQVVKAYIERYLQQYLS